MIICILCLFTYYTQKQASDQQLEGKEERQKKAEMAGSDGNKEEKLPPGFRFHPTDEELITFYLVNKIADATFTARALADVDLNKCEPWELPGSYNLWISSSIIIISFRI